MTCMILNPVLTDSGATIGIVYLYYWSVAEFFDFIFFNIEKTSSNDVHDFKP